MFIMFKRYQLLTLLSGTNVQHPPGHLTPAPGQEDFTKFGAKEVNFNFHPHIKGIYSMNDTACKILSTEIATGLELSFTLGICLALALTYYLLLNHKLNKEFESLHHFLTTHPDNQNQEKNKQEAQS